MKESDENSQKVRIEKRERRKKRKKGDLSVTGVRINWLKSTPSIHSFLQINRSINNIPFFFSHPFSGFLLFSSFLWISSSLWIQILFLFRSCFHLFPLPNSLFLRSSFLVLRSNHMCERLTKRGRKFFLVHSIFPPSIHPIMELVMEEWRARESERYREREGEKDTVREKESIEGMEDLKGWKIAGMNWEERRNPFVSGIFDG